MKNYYNVVDEALLELKNTFLLGESSDYLAGEASFLNALENYPASIETYQQIRKSDPFRFQDLDNFSNILFTSNKKLELSTLAHELNDIDPYWPEVCIVLANYYSLKGDHNKAIDFFDRAVRIRPDENSGTWILLGHEYSEINEPQMAIQAYKKAQQVDENDHRCWYALGQQYEFLEMHTASLYYYSKAEKLHPYNSVILAALAAAYNNCGKPDCAEVLYKRCVNLANSNVNQSERERGPNPNSQTSSHTNSQTNPGYPSNLTSPTSKFFTHPNDQNNNTIEGQQSLLRLANFYREQEKEALAAHYYSLYIRKLEQCQAIEGDGVMEVYIYLARFFYKEGKFDLAEDYAKEALGNNNFKDEAKGILGEISLVR